MEEKKNINYWDLISYDMSPDDRRRVNKAFADGFKFLIDGYNRVFTNCANEIYLADVEMQNIECEGEE